MFVSPNAPTDYPIKTGYYDQIAIGHRPVYTTPTFPSSPPGNTVGQDDSFGKLLAELTARLSSVEQRLARIETNRALERKWAQLRELGDQYRTLEAEILEKEAVLAKLSEPESK